MIKEILEKIEQTFLLLTKLKRVLAIKTVRTLSTFKNIFEYMYTIYLSKYLRNFASNLDILHF